MKKFANVIYYIKIILFIAHFYLVFAMLNNILDTKIYGIIFILFYLVFVIKVLMEVLSQNKKYKNDIIYNIMQIGFIAYLIIMSIKTSLVGVYVTRISVAYFRINYVILSGLVVFILLYNVLENKSSVKWWLL